MTSADYIRQPDSIDRMAAMHRQQLSALMDGELPADQSRFLIRRLEHDQELAGCQERWQLMGDVLRGQLGAVAPVDFAGRLQVALDASAGQPPVRKRSLAPGWIGGGALAAALAVMALVPLLRQSGPDTSDVTTPVVAGGAGAMDPVSVPVQSPSTQASGDIGAAKALPAVGLATPSPAARIEGVASRGPSRPAVSARAQPSPAPGGGGGPSTATIAAVAAQEAPVSPFGLPGMQPEARPWPRSSPLEGDPRFTVRLRSGGQGNNPFAPEVAAEHLRASQSHP